MTHLSEVFNLSSLNTQMQSWKPETEFNEIETLNFIQSISKSVRKVFLELSKTGQLKSAEAQKTLALAYQVSHEIRAKLDSQHSKIWHVAVAHFIKLFKAEKTAAIQSLFKQLDSLDRMLLDLKLQEMIVDHFVSQGPSSIQEFIRYFINKLIDDLKGSSLMSKICLTSSLRIQNLSQKKACLEKRIDKLKKSRYANETEYRLSQSYEAQGIHEESHQAEITPPKTLKRQDLYLQPKCQSVLRLFKKQNHKHQSKNKHEEMNAQIENLQAKIVEIQKKSVLFANRKKERKPGVNFMKLEDCLFRLKCKERM